MFDLGGFSGTFFGGRIGKELEMDEVRPDESPESFFRGRGGGIGSSKMFSADLKI